MEQEKKYSGFLALECEVCGRTRVFYARYPISFFECSCGQRSRLEGQMKLLFAKCAECGHELAYRTNSTAKIMTVHCLRCDTPIDTELRTLRRRNGGTFEGYQTIQTIQ